MTDKDILISDLNDISEILNNNGYGGWCARILKAVDLLKEQEEKLKFLDALYNYINPNDMEKYMQMYKSLPIPSDGRSVKWE